MNSFIDPHGSFQIRKAVAGRPINPDLVIDQALKKLLNELIALPVDERATQFLKLADGNSDLIARVWAEDPEADRPPQFGAAQSKANSQDLRLADYEPTDAGNADACELMLRDKYLYCPALGWLSWAETHWERMKAEESLREEVINLLRRRRAAAVQKGDEAVIKAAKTDNHRINAVIQNLQAKLIASVNEFDTHDDLLCVSNGIIDMKTGQQMAHDPSYRLTYCLNVEYVPNADIDAATGESKIDNFIGKTIGVEGGLETAKWLQRFYGYSCTGWKFAEFVLWNWGVPRSGKGSIAEAIQTLLGPLVQTSPASAWTEKREDNDPQGFGMAALRNARLVIVEEVPAKRIDINKIKNHSGNGMIIACFKGKDQFQFRPRFKQMFISNNPLDIDVDDDAGWGRFVAIKHPNSYLGREDLSVKERLKTPELQRALLAWVVRGAVEVWHNRHATLHAPKALTDSVKDRREELDGVSGWIEECCKKVEGNFLTNEEIRLSYEPWCIKNGCTPKQAKSLPKSLSRHGIKPEKRRGQRGYVGLKLKLINLNEED